MNCSIENSYITTASCALVLQNSPRVVSGDANRAELVHVNSWKLMCYFNISTFRKMLESEFCLLQLQKKKKKKFHTPPSGVSLTPTWCNGSWYRGALHIVFNSKYTDVVLHSWTKVVQCAGVLACLDKLLHTVAFLAVGGSARHFVASDV